MRTLRKILLWSGAVLGIAAVLKQILVYYHPWFILGWFSGASVILCIILLHKNKK